MPLASRRNRRPKICVCPTVTAPPCDRPIFQVQGVAPDNFVLLTVDPAYTVIPGIDATGFILTLDGVDVGPLDFADPGGVISITFAPNIFAGQVVVLTAPPNSPTVAWPDSSHIYPGDYTSLTG